GQPAAVTRRLAGGEQAGRADRGQGGDPARAPAPDGETRDRQRDEVRALRIPQAQKGSDQRPFERQRRPRRPSARQQDDRDPDQQGVPRRVDHAVWRRWRAGPVVGAGEKHGDERGRQMKIDQQITKVPPKPRSVHPADGNAARPGWHPLARVSPVRPRPYRRTAQPGSATTGQSRPSRSGAGPGTGRSARRAAPVAWAVGRKGRGGLCTVIVAIEGIDGAGKRTLTEALLAALAQAGRKAGTLAFPR